MAGGIFASKAEAEAFAPGVLGFMCRVGVHGSGCGWIGPSTEAGGLSPWPMPIGFGVKAWCSCSCHSGRPGFPALQLGLDLESPDKSR